MPPVRRLSVHDFGFILVVALSTLTALGAPSKPEPEIILLTDLAQSTEQVLVEQKLIPAIGHFLQKWSARGFSLSANRLTIVVEPNGKLLEEKGLSGFYGPAFAPALAALNKKVEEAVAIETLFAESKRFAVAFPPLLREEASELEALSTFPEVITDLPEARRRIEDGIKFKVQSLLKEGATSLGGALHSGGLGYFSGLEAPGSGLIYLSSADVPGEYAAGFKNTDIVYHELFHGLLFGNAPTIRHYRSLNEVLADVAAATELNDPCCLHFQVPGKQKDYCLRHMQRPSESLADALWSRGGDAGEYGTGQSLRRFFWDLYRELGKAVFDDAFVAGMRGLELILQASRVPKAFFQRAESDPFLEESLDQRQFYVAASHLLTKVCLATRAAKVCERKAEYLGVQDENALERLERNSPSTGKKVRCDATGEEGSFYYDRKNSRWGLQLGTTSFYPLTFSVDEKTHSASLEYRSHPRVLEWTSEGVLKVSQ